MVREYNFQHFKKSQNLNAVFHTAIQNIEQFARHYESNPILHVLDFEVEDNAIIPKPGSIVRRLWRVTRYFVESLFSKRFRKKLETRRSAIQEELLRSIATVKKHHWIIDHLKEGSEEQQKLGTFAISVIKRFNEVIQKSPEHPRSFSQKLTQYVFDKMCVTIGKELKTITIEFPSIIQMQSNSPNFQKLSEKIGERFSSSSSKKVSELASIFNFKSKPNCQLTQQEMDAFCMKAITMIKNHAIPINSIREALNSVKTQPIIATVDPIPRSEEEVVPASIVSLSQTLSLFPGEVIELIGAFKRNSQSHILSTPISDRFQLSSRSVQNGFPHPSQHHGWTLSDKLIPTCPLRMDRLPHLQGLLVRKKQVAMDLLPTGSSIGKARQILKLKKQGFEEQKRLFLSLHRALGKALFRAANALEVPAIDSFFSLLAEHPAAFENLTKTGQLFIEQFIDRPYDKLERISMDGSMPEISQSDSAGRFAAAEKILLEEIALAKEELLSKLGQLTSELERAAIEYLIALAEVLTPATNALILQQYSEKIEFTPPVLATFAQIVQASLFKQVQGFHEELSLDLTGDHPQDLSFIQGRMKQLLEADLALFKVTDFSELATKEGSVAALTNELGHYYNQK